jgi:hypothetical protein
MSTVTTTDLAEHVITTLRAREGELREVGIWCLSLFGSVACGDAFRGQGARWKALRRLGVRALSFRAGLSRGIMRLWTT